MREQVAQLVGAPEELHLGSQAVGLGGNCYKSSAQVSNKAQGEAREMCQTRAVSRRYTVGLSGSVPCEI